MGPKTPALIFVDGVKIHYHVSDRKEAYLYHGKNEVEDPELLLAILKNPIICHFDPKQILESGIVSEEQLNALGYDIDGQDEKPVPMEPLVNKPIIKKPSFAAMTIPELKGYAEKYNVVVLKKWSKDDLVSAIEKAVSLKE